MSDLSLDLNKASLTYKDYLLINGDLALTLDAQQGGADPVQQDILQAMSTFQEEWYLDNSIGVPWFQQILVKAPDQSKVDAILVNTVLSRLGVVQLLSYDFSPNAIIRNLEDTFAVQRTNGTVDYSGTSVSGGT